MLKKGHKPKTIRTKTSSNSSKIQFVASSLIVSMMVYVGVKAVTALNSIFFACIAALVGYAVYKMQMYGFKRMNYSSILFSQDYFIVNFDCREPIKIRYDDVVKVSPAFESMHTTLTITGDCPILHLPLYDLENNTHRKFVKFLENRLYGTS